jgi:hypothetical protein
VTSLGGSQYFNAGAVANILVIASTGNVGIGKTTPIAKLDVSGSVIISGSLAVTSAITASVINVTNLNVVTVSSSLVYSSGSNTFGNSQGNKHQFTGSVEITASLTVNSAGGTNAISSTSGTGYSFLGTTSTGILYGGTVTSGTDRYFLSFTGNVNSISIYENSNTPYINSYAGMVLRANQLGGSGGNISLIGGNTYVGGNLGVGTSTPTLGALQVHNSSGNTIAIYKGGGGAALAFGDTSGPTNYALLESISGGGIRIYTGNGTQTEKVRIDVNGNVGINTTTPNAKLEVNGNAIISGSVNIDQGTNYGKHLFYTSGTYYPVYRQYKWAGGGTNYYVGGLEADGDSNANGQLKFGVSTGFSNVGSETMVYPLVINGAGSVGVGKSSPVNSKLDINGNTIITGSLTVTGSVGINGIIGFGSKAYTVTNSYTTGLTINLTQHTGIFIRVTLHGDLSGNSAIAFMGEYFIQNGDGAYAEPGIIIREVNNTNNGSAVFSCQIVDPAGTGARNFEMQFKQNSATASVGATLIYQIQGNYNSVS